MVKIFIDAGHGGRDGGAQGNGLSEKILTLAITKKIVETLQKNYSGVEVKASRLDDRFLELSERVKLANDWGANAFISVHINSAASTAAQGFETHIYNGYVSSQTVAFQNVLHEEIFKKLGSVQNRGKKKSNFHVIRETNMPAVLTENLFISNKTDTAKLSQTAYINEIAQGHVLGLEKFFGLSKRTPEPAKNTSGPIYAVQCGAFANLANAEGLKQKLIKDGYPAIIIEK